MPQEAADRDRPESAPVSLSQTGSTFPTRLAGISILIVDDIPANADALRELLKLEGCSVDVAVAPDDALDCLSRKRYDAVISDLTMPGMNGRELIAAMRASGPNARTPAIAYSGYSGAEARRESGFDLHLVKPAGLDSFVDAILRVVARRTPY